MPLGGYSIRSLMKRTLLAASAGDPAVSRRLGKLAGTAGKDRHDADECPRGTIRQDRPGPRAARPGLRRRLLRPAGVEARGGGHEGRPRRDRRAGARVARRPREAATGQRRDEPPAPSVPRPPALRARSAHPHRQRRTALVRRGVQGALRRGRADASAGAFSADSRHAREAVPGPGVARRALRRLAPTVRDSAREARWRVSDRHQGVPRADGRSTSRFPPPNGSPSST